MTDRDLLELAAKAAGYDRISQEEHDCGYWTTAWKGREPFDFDPLTKDGDALRLAVSLRLIVDINDECGDIWVRQPWNPDCEVSVAMDDDPYAATRRAIVRAAAEIGRGME